MPDKLNEVFDDKAIEALARTAKLPRDADKVRFGADIRDDVRIFLVPSRRLSLPQLRNYIEKLYRLNNRLRLQIVRAQTRVTPATGKPRTESRSGIGRSRVLLSELEYEPKLDDRTLQEGDSAANALATAVDAMPDLVMTWLQSACPLGAGAIPTGAEILSPKTRQSAVRSLSEVLSHGGGSRIGRKRGSDKHSEKFAPKLNAPSIKRNRPRQEAHRELVQNLALTYEEHTGKEIPFTATSDGGPFPSLVSQVFDLIGMPSGNVPRLINEFGRARKKNRLAPTSE
jgi:hypothetical protein